MSLNIIAPTIKDGGGKELLSYLVEYLEANYPKSTINIYINKNICIKESTNINVIIVESIFQNFKLFWTRFSNVIYFGNLPPFRKVNNSVVYFHNRYLLLGINELFTLENSKFINKLKNLIRQLYINFFIKNVDFVACQNRKIKEQFILKYNYQNVEILPFFKTCSQLDKPVEKKFDFCYISLAHPHKNHNRLLDALEILADKGIRLNIALTIEKHKIDLNDRINRINKKGIVKVDNFGNISKEEVCSIYKQSKCLVFPSTSEAFGLPLVEAVELGLDVLASNLDFTFEVVNPSYSFDPYSPVDMANTIIKYLAGVPPKSFCKVDNKIDILIDRLLKNSFDG